jgi:uncharacterized protein (TIGR02466 family)
MVGRSDVFEIFAEIIGSYNFPHEDKTRLKQLCFDIIDKYKNNREYIRQSAKGKVTHYFDPVVCKSSLLDHPGFETFNSWIKRCSIDYINNIIGSNCDDVIITQCWINDCSKGGSQSPHNHMNSLISGTYFVNCTPEIHAPLIFNKPNIEGTPYLSLGSIRERFAHIEPCDGTLLLWESHINHGYHSNDTDKRISISFNVIPETIPGMYGFKITRK